MSFLFSCFWIHPLPYHSVHQGTWAGKSSYPVPGREWTNDRWQPAHSLRSACRETGRYGFKYGWYDVLTGFKVGLIVSSVSVRLFMCLFRTAEPDCVDRNGRLCSEILKVRLYEVPHPIQACVLGINRFFAYCHKKKLIQRFPLPQVFFFFAFSCKRWFVFSVFIHLECVN